MILQFFVDRRHYFLRVDYKKLFQKMVELIQDLMQDGVATIR
jgi:hypothetical protein